MSMNEVALERISFEDYDAFLDQFQKRGWTDGLPVVPPTPKRVQRMLDGRDPNTVIGPVPRAMGVATVGVAAVNAVMAGCQPAEFPVVLAAIRAVLDPDFNLAAVQSTTNPVAPLLIINGPIALQLGIASGSGALGHGFRANLTIARAVRLLMITAGGGLPETTDHATLGQPGKIAFCLAENMAESPWAPLHTEWGCSPDENAVIAVGASGTQNIRDPASTTGKGLLITICQSIAQIGGNDAYFGGTPVLLICPEHAQILAADGFGKAEIKAHLFEHARIRSEWMHHENVTQDIIKHRGDWFEGPTAPNGIPLTDKPEEFLIAVAGGAGRHTTFIPSIGVQRTGFSRV